MPKREWKVGGKYRCVDLMGLSSDTYANGKVAKVLNNSIFEVIALTKEGYVKEIKGYHLCDVHKDYEFWLDGQDIRFFEEVEDASEQDVVVECLDKLVYVLARDHTVNEIYRASDAEMEIFSNCGSITGNQNVAEFINNRYSQLIEQANKSKREELLAEIVKAKEVYEKLVGELNGLEGK